MKLKKWKLVLLLLFLLDIGYSGWQYYYTSLDGDIAPIVVPSESYQHVLNDPIGLGLIRNGGTHDGPNRFFAHWSMKLYWESIPAFLRTVTDPVHSLYLSSAIVKVMTHLLIVFLLAYMCTKVLGAFDWTVFFLSLLIFTLFFQNETKLYTVIGIIDYSNTYVFFYALPIGFLLLYLTPFFEYLISDSLDSFNLITNLGLILGALVLPLSGPLNLVLVLLLCPTIFVYLFLRETTKEHGYVKALSSIPKWILFHFGLIMLVSLYSFYLSGFNSENAQIPIGEAYDKLFSGVVSMYFSTESFFLISFVVLNVALLYCKRSDLLAKRLILFFYVLFFLSVVYVLMLPLGGYRSYRPNIIRYDVVIPISLGFMFFLSASSIYFFNQLSKYKYVLFVFLLFITVKDFPPIDFMNEKRVIIANARYEHHMCEKAALYELHNSNKVEPILFHKCDVLDWGKTNDWKSGLNSEFLKENGVLNEGQRYYMK